MIKDVKVIPLVAHEDDRGYLIEIARAAGSNEPHAVVEKFGQVYIVADFVRGVVRAFKKHTEQPDILTIVHGTAKFVLKDDRPDSPSYGEMMTVVIGQHAAKLLVIPPNVYYGWMSLEDDTLLFSLKGLVFDADHPGSTRIPADSFGDVWTVQQR